MRGIYLIRHGNTTYDHKVDALLDPPMDPEGFERVKRTVAFLRKQAIKFDRIISSPLQRALGVAELVSDGQTKVTTNNACLPWNLGDLMGKTGDSVAPQLDRLKEYPDLRPPHGESYRTFYHRWSGFLYQVMRYAEGRQDPVLITTHSRNINALQSIIGGNPVGDVEELVTEASVTLLAQNGVRDWSYSVVWEGK
jgi:broad specificity phosphatase PhoE